MDRDQRPPEPFVFLSRDVFARLTTWEKALYLHAAFRELQQWQDEAVQEHLESWDVEKP